MRKLSDLPWAGIPVKVNLLVFRYYCRNENCGRKIFTERFSEQLKPYARRISRLTGHLNRIGCALGGNAGSKLACCMGMPVSSSTLLRIIYQIEDSVEISTPRILGVDDWAFRKGHNYGTILVDLEKGKPIDLLPDREAETLANWLKEHPGVEVISRDRASFYKDGATQGAPQAIQVADRWHVLKNVREMLKKVFEANRQAITQATKELLEEQEKGEAPESTPKANYQGITAEGSSSEGLQPGGLPAETAGSKQQAPVKTQRELDYERVKQLHAQQAKVSDIARKVNISRTTVYKYINADSFPEASPKKCFLTPYLSYLCKRIEAGLKKVELYDEIVAQGYQGTYRNFCQTVSQYFPDHQPYATGPEPDHLKMYTPHQLSYQMIKSKDKHSGELKSLYKNLFEISPSIKKATELSWQFCQIVRHRKADEFDDWLAQMEDSGLIPLVNFATGVRKDYDAIKNACTLEWSNGQVEGQVNRLKNIKRQMYGRAGFKLLRKRILMDSS